MGYFQQASSNSREEIATSESPIIRRKPSRSSMLINTDLEEDDDYYEDEHDDFGEDLDKENEGIQNVDYVNIILVAKVIYIYLTVINCF